MIPLSSLALLHTPGKVDIKRAIENKIATMIRDPNPLNSLEKPFFEEELFFTSEEIISSFPLSPPRNIPTPQTFIDFDISETERDSILIDDQDDEEGEEEEENEIQREGETQSEGIHHPHPSHSSPPSFLDFDAKEWKNQEEVWMSSTLSVKHQHDFNISVGVMRVTVMMGVWKCLETQCLKIMNPFLPLMCENPIQRFGFRFNSSHFFPFIPGF